MKAIFTLCIALISGLIAISQNVDKAMEYFNSQKYDSAAMQFEAALPFLEQNYGANDTSYFVKQVNYTAQSFENIQQFEKAEKYYLQVKSIFESHLDTLDLKYAVSLHNLAKLNYQMGNYNLAESFFKRTIKIDTNILGVNHLTYASDLNDFAALYYQMGNFTLAESFYIQALEIQKKQLGEKSYDYSKSLSNLSLLYWAMGSYEKAAPLSIQAIQIIKIEKGENDHEYATSLNNLGLIYHDMGKYQLAEPLFKQAIEIARVQLGENNSEYGGYLNNLAEIYNQMGHFEQAITLINKVIEIDKKILGENHPTYAMDLNNLAMIYYQLGQYEQVELLMKQTISITRKALGENHPMYAGYLNNLAQFYMIMGRLEQAEPLMKQALEIDKTQLGENHPNFAIKLNTLSSLYSKMGRYEQAEILVKQVLELQKNNFGENNPNYAKYLNRLATLYYYMARYELEEPLLKQALEITTTQLGENHPDNATTYNSLSMLYKKMGNNRQAEIYLKKAIENKKINLGENHPDYAIYLNNLANLYNLQERYMEAGILYNKALHIYKDQIKKNTGFLSEKDLKQFLNTFIYNLDIYQSFYIQQFKNKTINCDFVYDIELIRKGILLKSALEVKTRILESGDTSLTNTYYDLSSLRKKIDKIKNISPEKRMEDPVMLESQADELEKTLALKSKDFKKAKQENELTWKDIYHNLKSGEAAIEFANFPYYNGKKSSDSILYYAVLISSNDTIPKMVNLTEESKLRIAIPPPNASQKINMAYYNNQLKTTVKEKSPSFDKQELYNLIWKPIDSLLLGINTVYFAPSGLLNSVSMAAITCPDNKFLMEKYKLVQLSSTRTLALPLEPISLTNAVVYGGINYDTDTTILLTKAEKYHKNESAPLAYNRSTNGENRNGFRYLPGTLKEAQRIVAKLEKRGIVSTTYSGTNAVEESFVSLSGKNSPSIIHLSTHGFYYPDTISEKNRKQMMASMTGEAQFRYSDDPLLRSGLLMAGANLAWKGAKLPPNLEDGILTAKEVSNMNLMNTQLVVLSACQTGQGDVKGSEGVEGLQRGFKMAGVRYLIMSLWEVPDKETTEFMDSFYDNWLGGMEIHEAFRATQAKLNNKYKNEPFKWAGFVLVE
ncbi:MAG: CHAT domain-containing tetratricopeptide repeat protein [Bacteroidota bacterium]